MINSVWISLMAVKAQTRGGEHYEAEGQVQWLYLLKLYW